MKSLRWAAVLGALALGACATTSSAVPLSTPNNGAFLSAPITDAPFAT